MREFIFDWPHLGVPVTKKRPQIPVVMSYHEGRCSPTKSRIPSPLASIGSIPRDHSLLVLSTKPVQLQCTKIVLQIIIWFLLELKVPVLIKVFKLNCSWRSLWFCNRPLFVSVTWTRHGRLLKLVVILLKMLALSQCYTNRNINQGNEESFMAVSNIELNKSTVAYGIN